MKNFLLLLLLPMGALAQSFSKTDITRWENQAKNIEIIRDNWGIPHVYGQTDADAVFGLMYAQCEDDFPRVEMNYVEKLGRLAEINGEKDLYNDLYIRLVIDSEGAINDYKTAPEWLKKLLNAFADGVNFYLYTHPEVKPALLTRFEPWYPLLWTDGSIGAISTGDIRSSDVKKLYEKPIQIAALNKNREAGIAINTWEEARFNPAKFEEISTGSNGFALSPSRTASGHSILYINPHTTFYFRPEVQVTSGEGLQAYGAVTWGQFFIYQGFNEHCGWMHTSSIADISDMYLEKVEMRKRKPFYYYNGNWQPVTIKKIKLKYKSGNGFKTSSFNTWETVHGPVMAQRNGQLISVKHNNRDMTGLIQSWQRSKANSFEDYKKAMELCANPSNNTVYADAEGNIAYWHGNFIPKRDPAYNWSNPVDGTTSATDWKGLHTMEETVHLYNPATGWIQNCNSTPFTVSGSASPKKSDYPAYMAPDGNNWRGINAAGLLQNATGFTIDKMIETGYTRFLPAFSVLLPSLFKAYEKASPEIKGNRDLKMAIDILHSWNFNSSDTSVATTLAVEWAQSLNPILRRNYIGEGEKDQVENTIAFADTAGPETLLPPMLIVINTLQAKFGNWQVPWGNINRIQRTNGDIRQQYDDNKPSVPVPFASALWGMLPSFNSSYFPGANKRYGISGNSFVCAVEFGEKVKAKSLLAGGNSSDPASPHFNDQLVRYAKGQFKEVLFYREDVEKHIEKKYHPGE